MPKQRLDVLFSKYLDQSLSAEEKLELLALLNDAENTAQIEAYIDSHLAEPPTQSLASSTRHSIIDAITAADARPTGKLGVFSRPWLKYAAAIVLISGIGLYFLRNNKTVQQHPPVAKADIQPGGNKATLTLADGTVITLDSADNTTLAKQGGFEIVKQANGQLVYKPIAGNVTDNSMPAFNTVSTPVGGQYQILLPDGSTVWLNALSSIRFPAVFTGNKRLVEVSGEAFFDIGKDASRPFTVKAGDIQLDVLGTEFNIMAYKDEQITSATLVSGAVKVAGAHSSSVLQPGQQAAISGNQLHVVDNVNLEEVLAWKNGKFYFNGDDIKTVMRQIGRWYDVQIVFEGNISQEKFEGEISRNSPLSEVLKILELTSIHYRLEGNKLTVMP